MTLDQFAQIDELNLGVSITRYHEDYFIHSGGAWSVTIHYGERLDQVRVDFNGRGPTASEAFDQAWAQLQKLCREPLDLRPALPSPSALLDDEIRY